MATFNYSPDFYKLMAELPVSFLFRSLCSLMTDILIIILIGHLRFKGYHTMLGTTSQIESIGDLRRQKIGLLGHVYQSGKVLVSGSGMF